MASQAQHLIEVFEKRYAKSPDLYQAPGRVNLIGEHTDYNDGLVLPIAIDLVCYAASAPNPDGVLRVFSTNFNEARQWPVDRIATLRPAKDWGDYIIGVARQIPQTRGRDVVIHSTVPVGSGLSSSASLEVSTALALGWDLKPGDDIELVKLCRRAENDFVGLPSGIMDQYVCVFGREHAAIKIDCRSLEHDVVPLPGDVELMVVNTMVKHELGQSAYRQRVAECKRAIETIGHSLRDATLEDLPKIQDPVVQRRARHVITEDQRVEEFVAASRRADLTTMGRLFVESHRSLQHDYEVSCDELDFLVDAALKVDGVFGARMTGGGFGGCTVNLLRPGAREAFEHTLGPAYTERFGIKAVFQPVAAAEGARKLS